MRRNPLIDEQALAALHRDAFGWTLFLVGYNADRAGDTLQAAYLKVVSGQAMFGGRSTLRTWLFGVIRLTAKEQNRSRLVPQAEADAVAQPPAVEFAGASAKIAAAVASLSRTQREVAYLVFYRDLSLAEAARIMDMRIGTIRTHYERAKKHLRLSLGDARGNDFCPADKQDLCPDPFVLLERR